MSNLASQQKSEPTTVSASQSTSEELASSNLDLLPATGSLGLSKVNPQILNSKNEAAVGLLDASLTSTGSEVIPALAN